MQNPLRTFGLWLARETKSKTTGETLPRWQLGRPYRPPTPVLTTEQAIKRGYTQASIVYACIRLLADTATSAPLNVYDRTSEDFEALPDHPLQALLSTPNPKLTRRRMYIRLVQHLALTGNSIWLKVRVPKNGPPTQLWPINPDLVYPVPNAKNFIEYYELALPDGTRARIEPRDVIHIQMENPETPWWGVGPLQAAMRDADLYLGNKAWNLRTVEHGAVTPGVLEVPEDLTDAQFATLRAQLDGRTFGSDDAGRDLILGSGMKYHRMSLTGEELGFLESLRFGREEIAMVFGVPPALLTPENATLANVEAYQRQFWNNTIVPLNLGISDTLTQSLVPDFDTTGKLIVDHDYSAVPAMQANLAEQAESAERLVRTGFTPAGVNRLLDLGFEDDEIEQPSPEPEPVPVDPLVPDAKRRSTKAHADTTWLDTLWRDSDRERTLWEERVAESLDGFMRRESDAVAAAFRESGGMAAAIATAQRNTPAWVEALTAVYVEAGRHFAAREYDRLAPKARKNLDPLAIGTEWARRMAARKVVEISATTEEGIRKIITDGLTPGPDGFRKTIDQIAAEIYKAYGITDALEDKFGWRPMRIARTELGFAMNYGHQTGAEQAMLEYDLPMDKGWSTSLDNRVRDSHAELHGEVVPMDARFSNGLEYPGDPNAVDPAEVVNCRCVVFHRVRR